MNEVSVKMANTVLIANNYEPLLCTNKIKFIFSRLVYDVLLPKTTNFKEKKNKKL